MNSWLNKICTYFWLCFMFSLYIYLSKTKKYSQKLYILVDFHKRGVWVRHLALTLITNSTTLSDMEKRIHNYFFYFFYIPSSFVWLLIYLMLYRKRTTVSLINLPFSCTALGGEALLSTAWLVTLDCLPGGEVGEEVREPFIIYTWWLPRPADIERWL